LGIAAVWNVGCGKMHRLWWALCDMPYQRVSYTFI